MNITLSNPTKKRIIQDYPLGGNKRGQCTFEVEKNNKGERCIRTTTGKPKADTYATLVAIADGSDGRTYILSFHAPTKSISVSRSDFKTTDILANGRGHAYPEDEDYETLVKLIAESAIPEELQSDAILAAEALKQNS